MIHVKDINQVTGYIRGGCTAIGMKKQYVTRIDESAQKLEKMIVSGGRLGVQIELKPERSEKGKQGRSLPILFSNSRNKYGQSAGISFPSDTASGGLQS